MNYDIYIEGVIGMDVTLASVRSQVAAAPKGTTELTLKINSGGGSVDEGFAIYDYFASLGIKINTEVLGMCGSIATIIQQVAKATNGERTIHANSKDFIHNPYWTPEAPIPMEASEALALAESLQSTEDRILDFYVKHTGKDRELLKSKMKAQTELSPVEAEELNLVDRVIGAKVQALRSYAIVAFINQNQNINNMDILKEFAKVQNKVDELINKFTPKIKNETKQTSEGVQIYYEGELGINTAVFTDEARTVPAPNGVHTVDGKKYTIADGKVTTVEDVADASAEALKAEIETLKAQLAEKETTLQNATAELTTVKAEKAEAVAAVETVNTEFKNLKAIFTTGNGELKPEFQAFKGDGENTKPNQKLNEKLAAKLK